MTPDPPHVFVVHGDLARMAVDDVLVPTDARHEVAESWLPLLPDELVGPEGAYGRRVLLPARQERVTRVPVGPRPVRQPWLVETVSAEADPESLVAGVEGFLDAVAADPVPSPLNRRARRLVGVPLVGTGGGGAAGRRGDVLRELLPALARRAAEDDVDVALVLRSASDHAAAQQVRRTACPEWPLTQDLQEQAQALAVRARAGELALFLGSGVSAAAGLPVWDELVGELAQEAGFADGEHDELRQLPAMDAGLLVARRIGQQRLSDWLEDRFRERPYALAHALLAALPVRELVTTNYDPLYETAARAVGRPVRVLPWQPPEPGSPWLLKLHGDACRPGSIVLTREHYLRFQEDRAALAGVVQALLLTRHVLFVGSSLVDDNVIRIAAEVRRVLQAARADEPSRGGTALALREEPVRAQLWQGDLEHLPVSPRGTPVPVAARRLEVLLDLVGALASAPRGYLLDPAYTGMLAPGERELAESLARLVDELPEAARGTSAWSAVEEVLRQLGA